MSSGSASTSFLTLSAKIGSIRNSIRVLWLLVYCVPYSGRSRQKLPILVRGDYVKSG
jgi:hypothetical protein